MKRKRTEKEQEVTPKKKTRATSPDKLQEDIEIVTPEKRIPSERLASRQNLIKEIHGASINGTPKKLANGTATPKSERRVLFSTPQQPYEDDTPNSTPTIVRNADRSARRKSARQIIARTIEGDRSDEEGLDEEDTLARQIWDEDGEEASDGEVEENEAGLPIVDDQIYQLVPDTPSKRGRGRPRKQKQKKRSPTPPSNLPPHEQYFYQNRPGGAKTSNNTLSSHTLLNHDEYFEQTSTYTDPHEEDKEFLFSLHTRAFSQWAFELQEGFNICLHGYGSKRRLVSSFAAHLHHSTPSPPKILIINGYEPTLTIRDVLISLVNLIPSLKAAKLPSQTTVLIPHILTTLSASLSSQTPIYLIINSLDASPLRKPTAQSHLALLASSPHIHLLATADTPNFPLLWDLALKTQFRFLHHDATTFASFDGDELDVVETVNEALGRSGRRLHGRDGVAFVLRSLPENARSLFRILVAEQVAAGIEEEDAAGGREGEEGVEYRTLYHKVVEEFVCSSEMSFRTLLKEFHDHRMVESRKDAGGVERLVVPFRREELVGLLEETV
ncbi:ORC2-domain-containing protein [Patellaria atrata CBS 101060]|uniref:Origin recognition complex subunit 2 n=1 Tax=Patellaria atrata CBS 101060 TaxID=1346257 RepID=A0A9P4VTH4_9PEZI|nr:ORC2-domain-containing protein [Patellaria atrata CBS 101060]